MADSEKQELLGGGNALDHPAAGTQEKPIITDSDGKPQQQTTSADEHQPSKVEQETEPQLNGPELDEKSNEKQKQRAAGGDQANDHDEGNEADGETPHNHHSKSPKKTASAAKNKLSDQKQKIKDKTNPPGGYDATPIPPARDGYTLKFTFHRAENLPIADLKARSSDPYILATLSSRGIQKRHKEDPDVTLRTNTKHLTTTPVWDQEWIVAGVPSTGFRLKCRLYDEDPSDHDDRLGNVTFEVRGLSAQWPGIKEEEFEIKKRMGSKRAYLLKGCMTLCEKGEHIGGKLYLSVEVLGPSEPPHGRMYTVGPCWWTKHQSPIIGRLAGTKAPNDEQSDANRPNSEQKMEKYNFQANQIQLSGPVPAELYHRYVEFKPFVKGMFSKSGPRGYVLNRLLHHQHDRIYNFNNKTEYGSFKAGTEEATKQFLRLVHFDDGSRTFTYVLTLDGLLRFTETGKEFSIDLLSKHTMHSDVNIYIACSGEFFIRRLKYPHKPADDPSQKTHPPEADLAGGPPNSPSPEDPSRYELIIDNDSGTYRPRGDLLPVLKQFLTRQFPGLHIVTKECTDDHLQKMKSEQRERRKAEGRGLTYVQGSSSDDGFSSSDEENLRDIERGGIHKSKRQRAYEAVEDPSRAFKEYLPGRGEDKEKEKEVKKTEAGEGSGSGGAA